MTEQTPMAPDKSGAPREAAYMFHTIKVIRGREAKNIAEQQGRGWELVSQTPGTLRTELRFRKVRPTTSADRLRALAAQGYAAFRRLETKTQIRVVGGVGALIAVLILLSAIAGGSGGGTTPTASDPVSKGAHRSEEPSEQASPSASPASSKSPSASAATASPTPKATPISVDSLLDKLNAAHFAGIRVGDEFNVSGELFESDAWGVGASGDYTVYLKAKGGKDDLMVLVDEDDAKTWRDGTNVQMVVKMVEVTIDGDTSAGWLRAVSQKTIDGGTTPAKKAEVSERKLWSDLSAYATTINKNTGTSVIDNIGPGSAHGVIHVALNLGFAGLSKSEAQATINTMNGQIVDLANSDGLDIPIVYYYVAGQEVGENHYITDPWHVSFKGMFD